MLATLTRSSSPSEPAHVKIAEDTDDECSKILNSHKKCLRDFIVHLHMYIDRFIHTQIAVSTCFM
jgi:hypothetical protein